jgi:CMP-N,N'-diacetyllegionaminic acid synthase
MQKFKNVMQTANNLSRFYLALIPARGGSKRIPRKNLTLLGGKPLIAYTIEAALASTRLARTIVSTDDEEIACIAKACGAEVPFLRPRDMAQDHSSVIEAIKHALAVIEQGEIAVDAVVLLQPTSPFRTGRHIDESIARFEASGADTVTAVCNAREHPYYAWMIKGDRLAPFFSMEKQMTARKDLPAALMENGSVYVIKRSVIADNSIYGDKIFPYMMDRASSVDIDTPEDLLWAEFISNRKLMCNEP